MTRKTLSLPTFEHRHFDSHHAWLEVVNGLGLTVEEKVGAEHGTPFDFTVARPVGANIVVGASFHGGIQFGWLRSAIRT